MSRENTELASQLQDVQKQITTGKRLVRMSEEPWTISQIHQLREETSVQSVFKDSRIWQRLFYRKLRMASVSL